MSAIGKLLARLHAVFNKDPQRVPAITLTSAGPRQVAISDQRFITTDGTDIPLAELTLQGLVDAINGIAGMSAELLSPAYADLLARAILSDGAHTPADDPNLYYPTSLLHAEMQTYSWEIEDQAQRLQQITEQLYMHSAYGDWLVYWAKDHFGRTPTLGESDEDYRRRTIQEIVSPNQNNKALEILVERALQGSICEVIDSAADPAATLPDGSRPFTWFRVNVGYDLNAGEVDFTGKHEQALALINSGKAAGTRIEELAVTGRLSLASARTNLVGALATMEEIEVRPSVYLAFEDDDDIITEDGDDLMK